VKQLVRFAVMQAACSLSRGCAAVGRGAHAQDQTCKLQIVVALAARPRRCIASPSLSPMLIAIAFFYMPRSRVPKRQNHPTHVSVPVRSTPTEHHYTPRSARSARSEAAKTARRPGSPCRRWTPLTDALPARIAPRKGGGGGLKPSLAYPTLVHYPGAIRHPPPCPWNEPLRSTAPRSAQPLQAFEVRWGCRCRCQLSISCVKVTCDLSVSLWLSHIIGRYWFVVSGRQMPPRAELQIPASLTLLQYRKLRYKFPAPSASLGRKTRLACHRTNGAFRPSVIEHEPVLCVVAAIDVVQGAVVNTVIQHKVKRHDPPKTPNQTT
jgi:hypothetical protein